ncbi:MAG TPA: hypothetical protein VL326_01075 [Kofleriaceae bacterium]|jgi:hypothetical protein|nr:hypothetical protein [Kofleriaceae bacterium]
MRYALLLLIAGCTTEIVDSTTTGHAEDPYTSLEREQREGPPRYTSRLHSCAKMRVATLGNVLASRGVNLAATQELSAGRMYRTSAVALGAANYPARTRENIELGVATASKIFDIYVQAAPEIIAAIPVRPECARNGQPAQLFDSSNHCVESGFSCLIGTRATPQHLAVCNETIKRANDPETGKQLAVALLAAAAHTCE